ncbi:MAG: hypothetical protein OXF75_08765 [Acidimicrobiaceae bacterium]|nr:hypothetical protein [Acidimicrobiaceae bacterium]
MASEPSAEQYFKHPEREWRLYGSRSFPLLDVVVVAAGVVCGYTIVACDQKWPDIPEAEIEVLVPE